MTALFTEETVDSWRDLHNFAQRPTRYIYRGQEESGWELKSSFVRECNRLEHPEDSRLSIEYRMLREFKRRAYLYERNLPSLDNDHVAWLAYMQHYGAPTRLIDFTYSLYVACFFALCAGQGDACVWAIDELWLRDHIEQCSYTPGDASQLREDVLQRQCTKANGALTEIHSQHKGGGTGFTKIPFQVFMIEPKIQNERLGIQQGLFLMQRNIHRSFLENLSANENIPESLELPMASRSSQYVKKLILPKGLRNEGLSVLRSMNITAESLFPGISGYSKSVLHRVLAG